MRAHLRRPSLLTKFSLLSLLVILALGLVIGSVLHRRIEQRALSEATLTAQRLAHVGLEPILQPGDFESYPTLMRLDGLDEEMQLHGWSELGIRRLKLFNRQGQIVYSDERSIVGESHPDSPGVQAALAGE